MRRDFVLVQCQTCGGAGEWDEGPLGYAPAVGPVEPEYRRVICPDCKGSGHTYVDAEEVDRDDDLLEASAAGLASPQPRA